MSNADNILVAYGEETSFGGALIAAKLINARINSFEPEKRTDTVQSEEIVANRDIVDYFSVGSSGAIKMGSEFSYGTYDEWLRAQLCSADWSAVANATSHTSLAVTVPGGVNTITRGAGAWEAGFTVGKWVRISGMTNPANNGYFKILTVSGTPGVMTVSGGTMVAETANASGAARAGGFISNGTTNRSFKFEGQFTDLSSEFINLNGKRFNVFDFSMEPKQIIKLGWELMGMDEVGAGATIGDGSNTAVTTTTAMNSTTNALKVIENGSPLGVRTFSFKHDNHMRTNDEIGAATPTEIKPGSHDFTGVMRMYFKNRTHMDAYRNFTDRSLATVVRDAAGNAYVIDFPSIKYLSGKQVAGGKNTDIIADMTWGAKKHPTEGLSCRITRFAFP